MDLEEPIEEEPVSFWKRPLVIIIALILIFIFLVSVIPLYSVKNNPPPDKDGINSFTLTSDEKAKLNNLEYNHTADIQKAINQIDVADYRMITNRLVSSSCSATSDLCYAKAVYYYVQRLQYISDPKYQYVQSPAETLLSGAGDCEDFSLVTSAMLESIGLDADIGVTNNHAFVRVQASSALSGDEYTWIDPTSDSDFGEISFTNKDVLGWFEVA